MKARKLISLALALIMLLTLVPAAGATPTLKVSEAATAVEYNGADSTTGLQPEFTSGFENFKQLNEYTPGLFNDVTASDWFEENIRYAYEYGLMKGTGNNAFSPLSNVTIAEVITLAARIHSIYFTASDNIPTYGNTYQNWYDPYVYYAYTNDIVSTAYDFSSPATREDVAHILANALPIDALPNIVGGVLFVDSDEIAYKADVHILSAAGVINGIQEDGIPYFRPSSLITRSEVATIVTRMADPSLR